MDNLEAPKEGVSLASHRRTPFVLAGFLYCVAAARADGACPSIELDAPGTPGAKVALYTQHSPVGKDTALCWAAAASQLVDFERARAGRPVSVHPTAPLAAASRAAYFALTEGQSGRDSIRNGYEYMALQAILKDGSCDQSLFGSGRRLYELADDLEAFARTYREHRDARGIGERPSKPAAEPCAADFDRPAFLDAVPHDVLRQAMESDSWVGALSTAVLAACSTSIELLPPEWGYQYASRSNGTSGTQLIGLVAGTLAQGRPVMAAIDSELGRIPGTTPTPELKADHVVLIVGQRVNPLTGACEALIRDSSVQVCRAKSRGGCTEPHHWSVPYDELERQLFAVTRMKTGK